MTSLNTVTTFEPGKQMIEKDFDAYSSDATPVTRVIMGPSFYVRTAIAPHF